MLTNNVVEKTICVNHPSSPFSCSRRLGNPRREETIALIQAYLETTSRPPAFDSGGRVRIPISDLGQNLASLE